jgi:hypothetical protein
VLDNPARIRKAVTAGYPIPAAPVFEYSARKERPMIQLTWQAASVLLAALVVATGWMAWYVKTSFRISLLEMLNEPATLSVFRAGLIADLNKPETLAPFRAALIKEVNGTYTKKETCQAWMADKAHTAEVAITKAILETTAMNTERRLSNLEDSQKRHNED